MASRPGALLVCPWRSVRPGPEPGCVSWQLSDPVSAAYGVAAEDTATTKVVVAKVLSPLSTTTW